MSFEYKVQFDTLEWIDTGQGIRYKSFQQNGFQLRVIEFSKGMQHDHWCTTGHMGYVIEGQLDIQFSNAKVTYKTGDSLFIPGGEEHKHKPDAVTEHVTIFSIEKT